MRDLLGYLVVGALVERGLSDFDVIGDCSHCRDALGCAHGYVLLVDRRDVSTERDRPIDSGHRDVLRVHLRVAFQLVHDGVAKDLVADCRLHPFTPSNEICPTGSARDRAARLFAKAAASASVTALARVDTVTVSVMSARLRRPSVVRHLAETLTSSGSPEARRNLRADHARSEAIEAMRRSSGLGASR